MTYYEHGWRRRADTEARDRVEDAVAEGVPIAVNTGSGGQLIADIFHHFGVERIDDGGCMLICRLCMIGWCGTGRVD